MICSNTKATASQVEMHQSEARISNLLNYKIFEIQTVP